MKATKSGLIIGIAQENYTFNDSSDIKLLAVQYGLGYPVLDQGLSPTSRGETLTNGWTIDQQIGKVTAAFTAGLDLKGNSLENVSQILSANGAWSIDEDGNLTAKKVTAETGEFKKGVTIFDEDSGAPYCIKVKAGNSITIPGRCEEAAPPPSIDGDE